MKDLKDQLIEKLKEYTAYLRKSFWSSYKIARYECEIDELEKQIKKQEAQEKEPEVIDEIIKRWAKTRNEWPSCMYYDGLIEGAKAMRDGKIK